jgi:predicted ATPase/class 3 adenylate cyclase
VLEPVEAGISLADDEPVRELPGGTVTFLFTDVEGSTRLIEELGESGYARALAEHRRVVREACERHGGVEVDTQGDAFFVAFPTAPAGLEAAREAQEALAIPVRMGIHTGTPLLAEEGYVGSDVHKAARIASAGHGGQVLVSSATAELTGADRLRDLGEHRLKDLSAPERIFQLGEDEFPRLNTLHQTNLPVPMTLFLGRERELGEIAALIERDGVRLLTLSGPGGTGKTRLALQAAGTSAESYSHGVFWVPLAPLRDDTLVLEQIAQAVGTVDDLAAHIADKRMLLLLDNFEHVVEAAPKLGELLAACPNLKLIVTSRELLRIAGEVEYPVPPLAETEAVELFCTRAQLQPDEAIAELCRRLDSLPLALELAAARVRILSPEQLLERLSTQLDLLRGGRDADPRQQTLRATIEWSHDLLSDAEQRLFARLAVFRGGCTLDAAEEVAEADLDTLQSLADKSLVRHTAGRFWMLETIRQYARERLAASDEEALVQERHAAWFERLAEDIDERVREHGARPEAFAVLEAEVANLRAALEFLAESQRQDAALGLVSALWPLWQIRGYLREGRQWLARLLQNANRAQPIVRSRALRTAGVLADMQDEHKEAEALLREALGLAREHGTSRDVALVLSVLGVVCERSGAYGEAEECYEESMILFETLGAERSKATVLLNLGALAHVRNDLALARRYYAEALALRRALGDRHGVAMCLTNLGQVELMSGHYDEAACSIAESLTLAEDFGDTRLIAYDLIYRASIEARTGRAQQAEATLHDALKLLADLGAREPGADAFETLAYAAFERGDAEPAARLLGAAARLREEIETPASAFDRAAADELGAHARSALGPQRFASAWSEGSSLRFEEALAYALALSAGRTEEA